MKYEKIDIEKRKKITTAAIGSVKCEGLCPSDATMKYLNNYSKGLIDSEQLHRSVMDEVRSIIGRQ